MKHLILLFLTLLLFTTFSCKKEDFSEIEKSDDLVELLKSLSPTGDISYFILPDEDNFAQIPQDPKNTLTPEKVALGKLLFHETGLAVAPMHPIAKNTYSCAACHHAGAGFQAGRWQGISEGGSGFGVNGEGRIPMLSMYSGEELDVQPIRSPSAMNGAYQQVTLWNGQFGGTGLNTGTEQMWTAETPKAVNHLGFEGLETQAIAGLEVHRMDVNETIVDTLGYKEMFDAVFGSLPESERYTKITAGLAIAAYERTLLANQAPFQKWLRGDRTAMSEVEINGALLFFDVDKGNCAGCHTGPALNSMSFHALGMNDLHQIPEQVFKASEFSTEVLGRGGFTGRSEDMYKFKTPQLYNLTNSPFFGHGSSFRTVRSVVAYKNRALPEKLSVPKSQLAEEFVPLGLTSREVDELTAFLETGLYDAQLSRYVPSVLPSGNCFPFNDPLARSHLDCN